jgi:integrase
MANIEKRTNNQGETTYRVKVRLKGHPSQSATFERLTDARKWAAATETAIREGRHFKTNEARKRTLSDAIERYEREIMQLSPKKNDINQRTYLKWWKDELGDYTLSDITTALIVEKRNQMVGTTNRFGKKIGTTTANRYTTALSHVFTIAVKQWEWLENNPATRLSKFKESRGRVRFLSDEERVRLLEVTKASHSPFLHMIVVLALSTGARKSELLTMQWCDVDFKKRTIILHETKNNERRILPMQGYAYDLMVEHAKIRLLHNPYVFPSTATGKPIDIRKAWETALKDAEIEDFRFHDLRHSAASYLAMNGASLAEIAEVLGHKTLQMVKRYAHLSEAHTAQVVASMNKRIFG